MKPHAAGHKPSVEALRIAMAGDGTRESPFSSERAAEREAPVPATALRLRALVRDHVEFTWRSLRRLGLPSALADDAVQRVFLVASDKLADIKIGSERAFLFQTALRVASSEKRAFARRREILSGEPGDDLHDEAPGADEQLDRHRARAVLEGILQELEMDLRAVFVLFELEGLSTAEIATTLDVPMGTVSSRLRRAREEFQAATKRYQARARGGQGGKR
jgi:RNA polymerase sigma-70 factor (ECF subfamily)